MTYYAYGESFDPRKNTLALKFRLTVEGHTAWMTGEFYHHVEIEAQEIRKNKAGKWEKSGNWEHYAEYGIHCCDDEEEAAFCAARHWGLVLA